MPEELIKLADDVLKDRIRALRTLANDSHYNHADPMLHSYLQLAYATAQDRKDRAVLAQPK